MIFLLLLLLYALLLLLLLLQVISFVAIHKDFAGVAAPGESACVSLCLYIRGHFCLYPHILGNVEP